MPEVESSNFRKECMEHEVQHFEVLVIGSGLSSLTSAALLAKRGIKTLCVEQHMQPGGSCGTFRLQGRTIDQGTSMFFGFGAKGFNPHRFVMNALEEPIDVVRHDQMYRLIYDGHPIDFHADMESFFADLGELFPNDIDQIRDFYAYIGDLYHHVIAADQSYMAPTEITRTESVSRIFRHPIRNMRLLPLLSKSAGDLLRKFVDSPEVVKFFSKLTSTYCYTTLDETPAILAITMFMENHTGGSYYAVGGSHQLPGKLEKAYEQAGGIMRYRTKAIELVFKNDKPTGAVLQDEKGTYTVKADTIIYGGTLYNLYANLAKNQAQSETLLRKVEALEMTYPSVVLYCIIDREVLPEGTLPIEMFADNPEAIDEKEVTMYAFSLTDPSLCAPDEHVVMAIGPSLQTWPRVWEKEADKEMYLRRKEEETARMLDILDSHFPGFSTHIREIELATPTTIERYTLKEHGSVAGPKQAMGQDLLHRQGAQGAWPNFYHCGEATVMGTGSLAVTISGISAANMVLRNMGEKEYRGSSALTDVVREYQGKVDTLPGNGRNWQPPSINAIDDTQLRELHDSASTCQWCLDAPCRNVCPHHYDIPAIMRRLECGNLVGARLQILGSVACAACPAPCKDSCRAKTIHDNPVAIDSILLTMGQLSEQRR
jgi:prolycopene isomerase